MNTEITSFGGWRRNMRLSNATTELLVTLDVGPRIICYRTGEGPNILGTFSDELGGIGEQTCMLRGGHRLWIAPELPEMTYDADNFPVEHQESADGHIFSYFQRRPIAVTKSMVIRMDSENPGVTIEHRLTNEGDISLSMASWGITIMAAGGWEIIPQPPLQPHPEAYSPNRGIILWPYTDLADPRWTLGTRFFMLRHSPDGPPTKMGLIHEEGWVAYLLDDQLFIKSIAHLPDETYPDGGCNFETFADHRMLEIESLGPLREVEPGDSVGHTEHWYLFDGIEPAEITSEEALTEWITPYLQMARSRA